MTTAETVVKNKTGLHARPAAAFSSAAAAFRSRVTIENLDRDGAQANAKSVVRVLTLGAGQGARIRITADGEDEHDAVNALAALIDSGFGEL